MSNAEVTKEQALAFLNVLIGTHPEGSGQVYNSPNVITHLQAVLGYDQVPTIQDVSFALRGQLWYDGGKTAKLIDYLSGVVKILEGAHELCPR